MPRASRLIAKGEQAAYHVMSRTALDGYPFGMGKKTCWSGKRLSEVV